MDIGEQIQLFQDFFELNYYDDIIKAVQKGSKHIDVDFVILSMFHVDLAQEILDNPEDLYKTENDTCHVP